MLEALIMSVLLAKAPAGNPSPVTPGVTPTARSSATPASGQLSNAARDEQLADELAAENLENENAGIDPLEFSQKERQNQFEGGIALNVGPVMPWSEYGASFFWKKFGVIQTFSLGGGNFEFSDNYKGRNYVVKSDSQSMYYAARWFVLGFGPIYLEPFAGIARWSGSIQPRGYDNLSDTLASSLNSRFDMTGVSVGGNFGMMWIFSNGVFIDYNFLSLSSAAFVQQSFTTNTSEAKKSVRRELAGPISMSNLQIRVGFSLKL